MLSYEQFRLSSMVLCARQYVQCARGRTCLVRVRLRVRVRTHLPVGGLPPLV